MTGRVFKFVNFFLMDLVWMGMVYLGKMCDSHIIILISIDEVRRSGSRIDRVRNIRYRSSTRPSQWD